jgi:uncharacterized protein YbjT (DUF2867 family)
MSFSSSRPKALVACSTGKVGHAACSSLVKAGFDVRACTRDPKTAKARELSSLGIEVVAAGDAPSLKSAASGCALAVLIPPSAEHRASWTIDAADAIQSAGVSKMIVISVPGAKLDSPILFGRQFGQIEKGLSDKGIKACFLRLPMFMDNLFFMVDSLKQNGKLPWLPKPESKFSPVAVSDVGDAIANVAKNFDSHAGKDFLLTSRPTSAKDICKSLSSAMGKPVTPAHLDDAAFLEFHQRVFPEWQAKAFLELFKLVDTGCLDLWKDGGRNDLQTLLGRPPITMEDFVERNLKHAVA